MSEKPCTHCGGDLEIRNPTGTCDHLYYPDSCGVCRHAKERSQSSELAALREELAKEREYSAETHARFEAMNDRITAEIKRAASLAARVRELEEIIYGQKK